TGRGGGGGIGAGGRAQGTPPLRRPGAANNPGGAVGGGGGGAAGGEESTGTQGRGLRRLRRWDSRGRRRRTRIVLSCEVGAPPIDHDRRPLGPADEGAPAHARRPTNDNERPARPASALISFPLKTQLLSVRAAHTIQSIATPYTLLFLFPFPFRLSHLIFTLYTH
ncbi:hypothetical protein DFH08DRAFT_1018494, partial [Mycena albidolilacea]